MAKHHPDLIMCRKQPGISAPSPLLLSTASDLQTINSLRVAAAIGRLCEKCEWLSSAAACLCSPPCFRLTGLPAHR